jgi:hypothetical protein
VKNAHSSFTGKDKQNSTFRHAQAIHFWKPNIDQPGKAKEED